MAEISSMQAIKKQLFDILIDECRKPSGSGLKNWALYNNNLKSFILGEISKEEFDSFIFEIGDSSSNFISVHNLYIFSILDCIYAK